MINWTYNAKDYEENSFPIIPVGDHRVRIESAEEMTSKTGRDMIKLTLAVSGAHGKLFHYVVFMEENRQLTNANLGAIFDSFGITPGDMDILGWRNRVGAARVKHELYEGKPQARISFFIEKSKQGNLPPWTEVGGGVGGGTVASLRDEYLDIEAGTPIPANARHAVVPF